MAVSTDHGADRPQLYELVISLLGMEMDIDRRVLVPCDLSLGDFHFIIQAAMGWENYHLHVFRSRDGTVYGGNDGPGFVDEAGVRLSDVLRKPGNTLDYEYDFGDFWEHRIRLAAISTDESPTPSGAACIGGRGACPPEDCGGVWGYSAMCRAMADPESEEYEDWAEWLDIPSFDPSAFDLAGANQAVRRLLPGRQ